MSSDGSVTHWINEIKGGNHAVVQALWERYFAKLVQLAKLELRGTQRRVADEEDVAQNVFVSFCRAAENGRFPDLADRESLWRLLIRMTARKAIDQRRHEARLRRGGGDDAPERYGDDALALVVGDAPSPEFAAIMAEEFQRLLDHLGDPQLQALALGKMEGYTNDEMKERLGCSLRTIERRLMLIREKCKQELLDE